MIASTTQIKPSTWKGYVLLLLHIIRVRKQLKDTPGLIRMDFYRGWRTLTLWESREDMKAFRNSGAHVEAMRNTARIGQAKTVTWEVDRMPTWKEAIDRLQSAESPTPAGSARSRFPL